MRFSFLTVKEFIRLRNGDVPTMLEGYPLTMSQILKVKDVDGKDILEMTSFEEAYDAVFEFEKKYGRCEKFSTDTRAKFLLWFISLDSDRWTDWPGETRD